MVKARQNTSLISTERLDDSVVRGERLHKSQREAKEEVPTRTGQGSQLSLSKGPVAQNSNAVLEETARSSGHRDKGGGKQGKMLRVLIGSVDPLVEALRNH